MIQSILTLGRQPELGLAELESLYGADAVSQVAPGVAGLTLHAHDVAFDRLGGSTRLAHVMAQLPATDWKAIERQLPELVLELALTLPPDGKIQLGLSALGLSVSPAKLNAMGLTLKKILRSRAGRSVRVTPNPAAELSTAQVLHNRLTGPTGVELLLIAVPATHGEPAHTIVARTTRVQDINAYTLRDRGRPKRDARVGMLPPKLAQIIINLAGTHVTLDDPTGSQVDPPRTTRLLDPFCGTGVVLQEALLMGYDVYGTDIEPRMIDYTGENLDWLDAKVGFGDVQMLIEPGDATSHTWQQPIDVVAGETYLGRPFTARPSPEVLAQTVSEVNLILKKFLANLHKQLALGTRLCLAVPAWQITPDNFKHLPLIDQISEIGYNEVRFEHNPGGNLLYYRPDQIVARELLVLTRK